MTKEPAREGSSAQALASPAGAATSIPATTAPAATTQHYDCSAEAEDVLPSPTPLSLPSPHYLHPPAALALPPPCWLAAARRKTA